MIIYSILLCIAQLVLWVTIVALAKFGVNCLLYMPLFFASTPARTTIILLAKNKGMNNKQFAPNFANITIVTHSTSWALHSNTE